MKTYQDHDENDQTIETPKPEIVLDAREKLIRTAKHWKDAISYSSLGSLRRRLAANALAAAESGASADQLKEIMEEGL